MATLFESYTETYSHLAVVYGAIWQAQTFTPSIAHTISSVHIYVRRRNIGGDPGTLTIGIRATSSGEPTGADLTSGTLNTTTISDSAYEWAEIAITPYTLASGTMYAIVARCPTGNSTNYLYWQQVQQSNGDTMYDNGSWCDSTNSGSTWTVRDGSSGYADGDFLFKEYGAYGSGELAGLIAIVEERLHYVDAYGDERYIQGTAA